MKNCEDEVDKIKQGPASLSGNKAFYTEPK